MDMREIQDVERGCGRLRKGVCYARGDLGYGGTLQAATLYAGIGHSAGDERGNLIFDMPSRKMIEIDLPLTLLHEELIDSLQGAAWRSRAPEGRPDEASALPHVWQLPVFALADHIGASQAQRGAKGYTAWTFGAELALHGPNRAIPVELAKRLSKLGAMPVVFTAGDIPFFLDAEHLRWFLSAVVVPYAMKEQASGRMLPGPVYRLLDTLSGQANTGTVFTPTWHNRKFTLRRGGYDGYDSWLMPVLWYMSDTGDTGADSGVELMEAPVWGSWFTSFIYTADGPDDPNIDTMMKAGIEPVYFEGDNEDDEE